MKNKAIVDMVMTQYGWDHRDVEVKLVSEDGNEQVFNVCHDHPYTNDPAINLKITVKVEKI